MHNRLYPHLVEIFHRPVAQPRGRRVCPVDIAHSSTGQQTALPTAQQSLLEQEQLSARLKRRPIK
jgi:hypothetical protein